METVRIALVLRSGGDFRLSHVQSLYSQIRKQTDVEILCLSDLKAEGVLEPLKHPWPGWWSKMNLFSPTIGGDLLYLDLDTVVLGSLDDLLSVGRLTMLSDFYRQNRPASGLMFLPERDRSVIWKAWIKDPDFIIRNQKYGDQGFIWSVIGNSQQRWQHILPGQVVSYKVHCRESVPEGARVVCFHGKPRPWDLPKDHPLYQAGY